MPLEEFLARRAELERCPALLGVCAVVRGRGLELLAPQRWPAGGPLPRLCGLRLEDVEGETIGWLPESPFLAQLEELGLWGWEIDEDEVVAALASWPAGLPRLRRLSWPGWGSFRASSSVATVVRLATSLDFPRLTHLEMGAAPRWFDTWGWPNRLAGALHGP